MTVVPPRSGELAHDGCQRGLLAALSGRQRPNHPRRRADRDRKGVLRRPGSRRARRGARGDPSHAFDTVGKHYGPIVRSLSTMPKPVIAAINGTCAGAGIGFALACDLRVAASGAKFAPAFTGIGLTADSGLSATFPGDRLVAGDGVLLLGTVIDADEALRIGLVHEVVDGDELAAQVGELAERLASGPTKAFAALKEALWYSASAALEDVLRLEAELQARLATSRITEMPCRLSWRRRTGLHGQLAANGRSGHAGPRPPRRPPQYDVDRLLAVAVEVFIERGYDGTSMEDLARATGLTKSSIYHHVESKEQLLRLAVERALGALFAVTRGGRRQGLARHRSPALRPRACRRSALRRTSVRDVALRVRGNTETERWALERRREFDAGSGDRRRGGCRR